MENLPSDVQFMLKLKKGNETSWEMIGNGGVYTKLIESSYTNPDPNTQFAHWWLYVTIGQSAEFGDFTPTIVIEARDSL